MRVDVKLMDEPTICLSTVIMRDGKTLKAHCRGCRFFFIYNMPGKKRNV